jgi:alpha-amylase/alpha-mannosidase (GH57 family)
MPTERYLCIHGHFYQPPRENPWLESVEHQESAYPFHDWNERITAECYAPNANSRILDDEGYITRIVSNYSRISFNFGPTLLAWLERARPDVYQAILRADGESRRRFSGHGSALAQAYNHSILPLCSPRDRRTQIEWGLRDFEHRFGREPEGMWLPETAVDIDTLEALAEAGLRFTVLAPHQAVEVRPPGRKDWRDVRGARIDPRRGYFARLPSGRSLALWFYDGPVSQAVAFEQLLSNGDKFRARLMGAFDETRDGPQLVHIATDGETYGHHHRHGDMALAYALRAIETDPEVQLTNYGEHLERFPPDHEVRIAPRSSWSCVHGIERWQSNCGCNTGGRPGWNQAWRAPLRVALDELRDRLVDLYDELAPRLLLRPWQARDAYVSVILDRSEAAVERFFAEHGRRDPADAEGARDELALAERIAALKLLEMQRHALLMYTSCAWFFDDLSGIETVQVLGYAGRAIQLAGELAGVDVETPFMQRLEAAHSNLPEQGDGAQIYERHVVPTAVDLPRLVAHYAVSSLFSDYSDRTRVHAYLVDVVDSQHKSLGRSKLAVGKLRVVSEVTREHQVLSFGILHLGDHNLSGGVRELHADEDYARMCREVVGAFSRADMPEALRLLDKHFLELTYSLRSLFRDEQRRVLDLIVGSAMTDAEGLSGRLYEAHSPLLRYLATLDFPLPPALGRLADFVLNTTLRRELGRRELDFSRIHTLLEEAQGVGIELDLVGMGYALQQAMEAAMEQWVDRPEQLGRLRRLRRTGELAQSLPFELDLSVVQNYFFRALESELPRFSEQADRGDPVAIEWRDNFRALGKALGMRV